MILIRSQQLHDRIHNVADVAAADERRGAGSAELAAGHRQDAEDPARAAAELLQRQGPLRALQAAHRARRLHRARGGLHLGELHLSQKRGTGKERAEKMKYTIEFDP